MRLCLQHTSCYAHQPGDSECARQDENARAGKFGFAVDNTIGGTPQPNGWVDDWVAFFRERRLLHQLRLANDAGLSRMGERLAAHLGRFFEGIQARCHAVMFSPVCWVSTLVALGLERQLRLVGNAALGHTGGRLAAPEHLTTSRHAPMQVCVAQQATAPRALAHTHSFSAPANGLWWWGA